MSIDEERRYAGSRLNTLTHADTLVRLLLPNTAVEAIYRSSMS